MKLNMNSNSFIKLKGSGDMLVYSKSRSLMLLCSLIMMFLFTGCAAKKMEMTNTGFLSSYSGMVEDENLDGMQVYRNPAMGVSNRYSKIQIAPVEFKLDPTLKEHSLSNEDKQKLTDYFLEELQEGLADKYELADEPGSDVLLMRIAITDILPNKVYLNLHWSTTLAGVGIGGASLEAELIDSLTEERMLSFVDARKGRRINYTKGLTKWGHTKEVLGIWAEAIIENIEDFN